MTEHDYISIDIEGTSHAILCGNCHKPVEFEIDGDEDSKLGCAACENYGTKDEVVKIASAFAVADLQIQLNRMAKDEAEKSKIMTFEGTTDHTETYQFVVSQLEAH